MISEMRSRCKKVKEILKDIEVYTHNQTQESPVCILRTQKKDGLVSMRTPLRIAKVLAHTTNRT